MGKTTKIQWTNATWNPWHGCLKVSAGCKFCYMYRDKDRYGLDPTIVLKSKTKFNEPLTWKKEPKLVFTCSWSDFFIEEADSWRNEAWKIIKETPHLTYQILTKRPERIKDSLPEDWGRGYPNVWLGVSVESLDVLLKRIPMLLEISAPIRFVSAEPLLENIVTDDSVQLLEKLDWIIVGGESGNQTGRWGYRETKEDWILNLLELNSNIPVYLKQLGTHLSLKKKLKDRAGANPQEWEPHFDVRKIPHNY